MDGAQRILQPPFVKQGYELFQDFANLILETPQPNSLEVEVVFAKAA